MPQNPTAPGSYVAGNIARLFGQVKDLNENLIDASTVTITITKPDSSTLTPGVVHDATGCYHVDVTTDTTGLTGGVTSVTWTYKFVSTGAITVGEGTITVTT